MQDEFYAVAFRKKIYHSLEEIKKDAGTTGLKNIIGSVRIQGSIASVKRPCKLSWIARNWRMKKCWICYNRTTILQSARSQLSDEVLAITNKLFD